MRHTPTCNLQKFSCYQKKCTLYEGITVCAHLLASHVQSCPPQQFFPLILLVVSNKISVQQPQVFSCARIHTAAWCNLCSISHKFTNKTHTDSTGSLPCYAPQPEVHKYLFFFSLTRPLHWGERWKGHSLSFLDLSVWLSVYQGEIVLWPNIWVEKCK